MRSTLKFLRLLLLLVVFVIAIILGLQNNELVSVAFGPFESMPIPLYLLLVIAFAVGMFFSWLLYLPKMMKGRLTKRKLSKAGEGQ